MQSFYISWQQEVLSGESACRPTGNLGPAKNNHVNWGWVVGGEGGATGEWRLSRLKRGKSLPNKNIGGLQRVGAPRRPPLHPPPPSPAEPILRDGTVSYQSEQQRLQIYGPLKLAIKIQRSCSFSRLEEPLGTLVPHRPHRGPPSLLWAHVKPLQEHERVRIDWVAVRGEETATHSGARSGLILSRNQPVGNQQFLFIPRPLWTDWSGTAPTCSHHNSIFVEKELIFSRETPTANITHLTEQYAD